MYKNNALNNNKTFRNIDKNNNSQFLRDSSETNDMRV